MIVAKSPAERLQELSVQVEILRDRDGARERDLIRLETKLDSEREARHKVELDLADLKRQFQDHLAQYQEWDRRRWAIFGILIGAVFSLASGLIVTLVRK